MASVGLVGNTANEDGAVDDSTGEFDCPICQDVLKTPIRTRSCRHVFCRSCFKTAVRTQGPHCPMCRGPVSEREKTAQDIVQKMRETRGPCRACGTLSLLSRMRSHYKHCREYMEEYGPPSDAQSMLGNQQDRANDSAQTPPSARIYPVHVQHPSSVIGSSTAVYSCPYCQQQGFSDMALAQHCIGSHAGDPSRVVCPICVATSWGDPNYCSRNFIGHLTARHRFSYDIYMNVREDEDTQLHLAIQQSILQACERRITR
ncbi:E3 ubiquitin-protein ligase RNF138-like [Megalops cyprinoides]|uniref:E3 ubiquitin-protein ligase RNF138-like n=1 Tax=Megalops cyprinoides TaxID=118141 RepID=UPI0018649244|nr:E3 ubiquitin-protein ligase RNF138-like [Megalops cyprinoides]